MQVGFLQRTSSSVSDKLNIATDTDSGNCRIIARATSGRTLRLPARELETFRSWDLSEAKTAMLAGCGQEHENHHHCGVQGD